MARPPIIISNGGVIGELAQGINDSEAFDKIKDNMERINDLELTEAMIIIKGGNKTPCIYWRLKEGNEYGKKFEDKIILDNEFRGREGISINDLVDWTDDLTE